MDEYDEFYILICKNTLWMFFIRCVQISRLTNTRWCCGCKLFLKANLHRVNGSFREQRDRGFCFVWHWMGKFMWARVSFLMYTSTVLCQQSKPLPLSALSDRTRG